jgi:pilus assembly protein CpaF
VQLPLRALRAQVASAIDFIVQTSRLRDGSRCVTHISEVQSYDPDRGYEIGDVFVRTYHGEDEHGRIVSRLEPTGFVPKCAELLRGNGYELPESIYAATVQRT